eukprot:440907-Pelagomonas_calceolata.AAC.1
MHLSRKHVPVCKKYVPPQGAQATCSTGSQLMCATLDCYNFVPTTGAKMKLGALENFISTT